MRNFLVMGALVFGLIYTVMCIVIGVRFGAVTWTLVKGGIGALIIAVIALHEVNWRYYRYAARAAWRRRWHGERSIVG